MCKLKWKGTKNSANTCPLSNQVQWLQEPRDGTWFVPCSSQWKQKLVLGIRRMSYYSFISFVFLTTNIFHFMSSKSEFNCCNYWSFRKKYNSRALIPPPQSIHVPWQWNMLLLHKNPLQCAHRPILVNIIWLQQTKPISKTISMSKTLIKHANSSEYSQ